MALKPFVFTDGTRLERGDWACIPLRAMLHDSQLYPDPMAFHGFRFAEEEKPKPFSSFSQPEGSSKLSDVSNKWHVWGSGKITWYGRINFLKIHYCLANILVREKKKSWKVLRCRCYKTYLGAYFEKLRMRTCWCSPFQIANLALNDYSAGANSYFIQSSDLGGTAFLVRYRFFFSLFWEDVENFTANEGADTRYTLPC